VTLPDNLQNLDWQKGDGLIPAIVQHARSGEVLMLAYMNEEALRATLSNDKVTFFSRSRNQLWQKGETSGNKLELVSISADCDQDTLLILAEPFGPTCHLGSRTCFTGQEDQDFSWLFVLDQIIESRRNEDGANSYTASLLGGPLDRAAQKVGEEGVETALAALADDPSKLNEEAADLLFHLMVLLRHKGQKLDDAITVLRRRHQPKP